MIDLYKYVLESSNDLSKLLKGEKEWLKISSSEYGIYISDVPSLYEIIPYKEYGLKKPDSILLCLKRDASNWHLIIKWVSDKNVYVCNGWKTKEFDIETLADKSYKIIHHLIKSKNARYKFKDVMLKYYNIIKDKNLDTMALINSYNQSLCNNDLEKLLII